MQAICLPTWMLCGNSIGWTASGRRPMKSFIAPANVALPVVKTPETALPWLGTVASAGDYLIEILNADSTAVQPYVLELRRSP